MAAPDVVCDPDATAELFEQWGRRIHSLGFPVAWVAQNGAKPTDIPHTCEAVFIGGDTDWKLGSEALLICHEAQKRGLWVHMGRVNSAKRSLIAAQMTVHSVDGTHLAFAGVQKGLCEIEGWVGQISKAPLQMRLI